MTCPVITVSLKTRPCCSSRNVPYSLDAVSVLPPIRLSEEPRITRTP